MKGYILVKGRKVYVEYTLYVKGAREDKDAERLPILEAMVTAATAAKLEDGKTIPLELKGKMK